MKNSCEKTGARKARVTPPDSPLVDYPIRPQDASRLMLAEQSLINRFAHSERMEAQKQDIAMRACMPVLTGDVPVLSDAMPLDLIAETMRHYMHPGRADFEILSLVNYLDGLLPDEAGADMNSQMLMAAQAQALNVIFNVMLQEASRENSESYDYTGIAAALLAQRQCRQNIEILHQMRMNVCDGANKLKEIENVG